MDDWSRVILWIPILLIVAIPVFFFVAKHNEKRLNERNRQHNEDNARLNAELESRQVGGASRPRLLTEGIEPGFVNFGAPQDLAYELQPHQYEQVTSIVDALIRDARASSLATLRWSSEPYPGDLRGHLDEAVRLKRAGAFLASVEAYDRVIRSTGVIYTSIASTLYKSVAASGALGAAARLLLAGHDFWTGDPQSQAVRKTTGESQSWAEEYLAMLRDAAASPEQLQRYMMSISGNVNYRLPRDYASAVAEIGTR